MDKVKVSVLALSFAAVFNTAVAYEQGDIVLRAGAAMVDPHDDSSGLRLNGVSQPGTGVSVDDDTQLGLTLTYMFSDKLGIELLAATPFSHTVTAHGLGADLKTADVKHLPPTVSAQYYPLGSGSAFQPYMGLGLNYTVFFDEELTSAFKNTLGDGSIELDDSVGLAFELGFDYPIADQWILSASVWKMDIDTTATIKLDAGTVVKTEVDIDPLVYMVSVGYKF